MGWRERDWAKFNDDEWKALVGGRSSTYSATTVPRAQPSPPPMPTRVRKRRPVGPVVALAAIISFGATVGVDAFHRLAHDATAKSTSPAPSTALRIRWGADDVVPAPSAGRICVNGTPAGQVCASYAVGEKPADVLTHQLQALGISVERAD